MNVNMRQHFNNFLTLLKIGESGGKATFNGVQIGTAETVTTLGTLINGAGAITTPGDADRVVIRDNASGLLAYVSFANFKATLQTWLAGLFASLVIAGEGLTTITPSAGAAGVQTLNLALGRKFIIDCSVNSPTSLTLQLSNVPTGGVLEEIRVLIKTHVSAAVPAITWPQGVTAPTLFANRLFILTLVTRGDANATRTAAVGSAQLINSGSFI